MRGAVVTPCPSGAMIEAMKEDDAIFVAGHRGLAGSALLRRLRAAGYRNVLTRTRAELDLGEQAAVREFFRRERPRHVFLAAALAGGIRANSTRPAQFIYENLAVQTNVIHAAWQSGGTRLLFLGSSCAYPRLAPQPIEERALLSSFLEPTNEPYAVAKIAGIKMCAAYNRQYGTQFLCVMPTNLYGPGDNYDLDSAHVVPALMRKMHEAKSSGGPVEVWGSGVPRREFLYVDDMADACVFVMERLAVAQIGEIVNVGTGEDVSIAELARLVARTVEYSGPLLFAPDQPDGTPRKLLDVSRLAALGWRARTPLEDGLRLTYAAYLEHQGRASARSCA
jgi:GDP-L-fucose synthase